MCVIERKTYIYADGRQSTIETPHRCRRATGSSLCSNVERRTVEVANVVERTPTDTSVSRSDAVLVTQGFNGRERVYRDISRRSSKRTSGRHSKTMSQPPSLDTPSSGSSPSIVEMRPRAPTPPPATSSRIPLPIRSSRRVERVDEQRRTVAADGTAVYDRPPSLELPRANENERKTRFIVPDSTRRSSISSTTAEVDEDVNLDCQTSPLRYRRRPSLGLDSAAPVPSSSSGSPTSPGLSRLPKFGDRRHDSADPRPRPRAPTRESDRQRQPDQDRRRREDERQAQLERDRLAESDRRQEARRNAERAARESSRERHRREAAAALEGQRQEPDVVQDEALAAEYAQMARERANAEARRARDAARVPRYVGDRYYETRTSPRSSRRLTSDNYAPFSSSPLSARSSTYPVTLHQYPAARRDSTLLERGQEVIAREQMGVGRSAPMYPATRRASQRLTDVLGDLAIDDAYDFDGDYELDNYYIAGGHELQRGESRRLRRDTERAERRRERERRG